MPIKTIEIICLPCSKCDQVKKMITEIIQEIEEQYKIRLTYEFKYTPNLQEANKYSVNIAKTPIVVINGRVELAGQITLETVRTTLMNLHKY